MLIIMYILVFHIIDHNKREDRKKNTQAVIEKCIERLQQILFYLVKSWFWETPKPENPNLQEKCWPGGEGVHGWNTKQLQREQNNTRFIYWQSVFLFGVRIDYIKWGPACPPITLGYGTWCTTGTWTTRAWTAGAASWWPSSIARRTSSAVDSVPESPHVIRREAP